MLVRHCTFCQICTASCVDRLGRDPRRVIPVMRFEPRYPEYIMSQAIVYIRSLCSRLSSPSQAELCMSKPRRSPEGERVDYDDIYERVFGNGRRDLAFVPGIARIDLRLDASRSTQCIECIK